MSDTPGYWEFRPGDRVEFWTFTRVRLDGTVIARTWWGDWFVRVDGAAREIVLRDDQMTRVEP